MVTYAQEFKCTMAQAGLIRCVTVSPNSNWVAIGYSSGIISILDVRTGLLLGTWKGHEGEILQVRHWLLQPQRRHLELVSLSSAKLDNIFWNKFEETLFRWLTRTALLQIFSHPHFSFWEKQVQMISSAQLMMSSAKPDNIFRNKFEEALFRWLTWTTFLHIFSENG
jgi:WD40 repeat protein